MIKKYSSIVISLGIVSFFVVYFIKQPQLLLQLVNMKQQYLLQLIGATILFLLVQGKILQLVVKHYSINITFNESFGLLAVTLLGNYIFPFMGLGFRAKYLNKVHGLEYKDFIVSLLCITIIEFLVYAGFGLLGYFFLKDTNTHLAIIYLLFMAGVFFASLIVLSLKFSLPFSSSFFVKLNMMLSKWHYFKRDKKLIANIITITALMFLANALVLSIAYHAAGVDINYFLSFIPTATSDFSLFIKLAPASLGTYEMSIFFSSVLMNASTSQSVLVIAMVRLSTILCFLFFGLIYQYYFSRKVISLTTMDDAAC